MRSVFPWFAAALLLHAAPCSADPPPAPAEPAPQVPPAPAPAADPAAGAQSTSQPSQAPAAAPPVAAPGPAPVVPAPAPQKPAPPPLDPLLDAVVHVAVGRDSAWLEARSKLDGGPWQRLCAAPCDRALRVEGSEFRVVAPGMTPSNVFGIGPGHGTARFQVNPGSATSRTIGIAGLVGGVPVAFAGMALFGVGELNDEPGLKTAGAVTLAVGAVAVVAALPFLLLGSTSVKDDERRTIAGRAGMFTF